MSDAASKRIKAMVAALGDPEAKTSMGELAAVLDAWVAHTDFIEKVRSDPGAALFRSRRFISTKPRE